MKEVDRRLGYFLLLGSGLLLVINFLMVPAFRVDDSYITFRYSTNLANGLGLVFNPGEYVEGISNPLWAVLLAGFVPLKLSLPEVARCLSALSAFACLYLVFSAVKRATDSATAGAFGALLLASHMGFVLWIYAGLETLFFAFLLTLLIHQILSLAQKPSSRTPLVTVCALCLVLPAARPESILLTLAISVPGLLAAFGLTRQHRIFWPLGCIVAGFVFLELFRFSYYGSWLPNTYYAKVDSAYAELTRLLAFRDVVENHPVAFLVSAAGLGVLAWRLAVGSISLERLGPCQRALLGTTLGALAADVVFIWTAGRDWMPGWRYFLPVLPALCILAAFGIFQIFEGLRLRIPLRLATTTAVLLAALALAGQFFIRPVGVISNAYAQEAFAARSQLSARELREFVEPGNTVAIAAAGIIPFSLPDVRFIDMLGLNDLHIARVGTKFSSFWEKTDVDSVLERTPDFILIRYTTDFGHLVPDPKKGCWPGLYAHPDFQANYERVASLQPTSLWLYKRIDRPDEPVGRVSGHAT